MPQRFFYIDNEKQQYLSATWNYNWSSFKLHFQDEVVCYFTTKKELVAGRHFIMPDGHLLSVRLKGVVEPELEILRDGFPLQSNNTSRSKQDVVVQLALFLGFTNIVAGAMAVVTQSDIMLSIGFGYGSIAVGAVYMLLAWGIQKISSFAVLAIVLLVALDMGLLFVFTAMKEGPTSPTSGLLIKLFLVYAFVRGLRAIKQIRSQAATVAAPCTPL